MRSVLNIGHSESEIETVTQMQKDTLFPLLKQQLKGNERTVLDFGCGPGRFTGVLASLINGRAVGIDPIQNLLDMAPSDEKVEYKIMEEGEIPLPDKYADIVWACLVFGGIVDKNILEKTVDEIERILKRDGLLFLIENTSEVQDSEYWVYRYYTEYKKLFHFISLVYLDDYYDLGERISIMAGRKL